MKRLIRVFIIVLTLAVISNSLLYIDGVMSTYINTVQSRGNEIAIVFSNDFMGKVLKIHYNLICDLYKKVNHKTDFEYLFDGTVIVLDSREIIGTGVCIDQDERYYYIISAQHVVTLRPENNMISIGLRNNATVTGEVTKEDVKNDLALIRVEKIGVYLEVIKISADNLKLGETVYAVGHPVGCEYVLTKGLVSNTRYQEFTVSNIVIAYGSSGGGLFNINGELVGINTTILLYELELEVDRDEYKIPLPLFALSTSVKIDIIREFLNGE